MPDYALTPAIMDAFERVKAMPHGPARATAWANLQKRYPFGNQRARLARNPDNSVGLTLNDPNGHPRLKLMVSPNGTPQIQFLDPTGKILRTLQPTS